MEGWEQVVDDAIGGTEQDPILLVTFVVVVVVVFFVELEWWWRVVESSLVCTTIWLVDCSYRCFNGEGGFIIYNLEYTNTSNGTVR